MGFPVHKKHKWQQLFLRCSSPARHSRVAMANGLPGCAGKNALWVHRCLLGPRPPGLLPPCPHVQVASFNSVSIQNPNTWVQGWSPADGTSPTAS